MSRKVTYYCDGCGKQRGEANHWWQMREEYDSNWGTGPLKVEGITVRLFRDESGEAVRSYCGQECLMKAVSEWMQSQRSSS